MGDSYLIVRVLEGKDLAPKNRDKTSDAYAVVYFPPLPPKHQDKSIKLVKQKTVVKKKELNPKWDVPFFGMNGLKKEDLEKYADELVLKVEVWDWELIGHHHFMVRNFTLNINMYLRES
jgi:hypothetical protein